MRRILHTSLLSGTILAAVLSVPGGPACAQEDQMYDADQNGSAIGLDAFANQLAPFGSWLYSDRWGLVWQPADVPYDFHPYLTAGHWVDTDDYGWYWQSDYSWGDIPFHYGRWVNDPDDGWMWIPGYVWSPGWVVWRSNDRYVGWMPMPPDEAFLMGSGDIGPRASFRFGLGDVGGFYGYSRWYGPTYDEAAFARNWVFVGLGEIAAPEYRTVAIVNPGQVIDIIHQTRNMTNYTVVDNHVVNRSINVNIVERAAGHPIPVVRAATVIRHPNLVATVAVGQRVQLRMRETAPHGTGIANSAPPPPPRVVARLSTHVPAAHGHGPAHLFTRTTVAAPEAQSRFHGAPARPAGTGANGQTTPNGEHPHEGGPNGMMGPNGEPSHGAQPNGMMGPNGERPHHGEPNGMMGPNGERPHEAQPNGMMGPNGERPHEAQPNGMMEPNGERPHEAQPNGMMGPNGERPPGAQPNGMMEPNGERPHEAQPNGMAGPNGEHPREAQPNGMTGGPSHGQPPATHSGPQAQPENGAPPNTPPKKKKPPQNPPQ